MEPWIWFLFYLARGLYIGLLRTCGDCPQPRSLCPCGVSKFGRLRCLLQFCTGRNASYCSFCGPLGHLFCGRQIFSPPLGAPRSFTGYSLTLLRPLHLEYEKSQWKTQKTHVSGSLGLWVSGHFTHDGHHVSLWIQILVQQMLNKYQIEVLQKTTVTFPTSTAASTVTCPVRSSPSELPAPVTISAEVPEWWPSRRSRPHQHQPGKGPSHSGFELIPYCCCCLFYMHILWDMKCVMISCFDNVTSCTSVPYRSARRMPTAPTATLCPLLW